MVYFLGMMRHFSPRPDENGVSSTTDKGPPAKRRKKQLTEGTVHLSHSLLCHEYVPPLFLIPPYPPPPHHLPPLPSPFPPPLPLSSFPPPLPLSSFPPSVFSFTVCTYTSILHTKYTCTHTNLNVHVTTCTCTCTHAVHVVSGSLQKVRVE